MGESANREKKLSALSHEKAETLRGRSESPYRSGLLDGGLLGLKGFGLRYRRLIL